MALRELTTQEADWVVGGRGMNPALVSPALPRFADPGAAFAGDLPATRRIPEQLTTPLPTYLRPGLPAFPTREDGVQDGVDDAARRD